MRRVEASADVSLDGDYRQPGEEPGPEEWPSRKIASTITQRNGRIIIILGMARRRRGDTISQQGCLIVDGAGRERLARAGRPSATLSRDEIYRRENVPH